MVHEMLLHSFHEAVHSVHFHVTIITLFVQLIAHVQLNICIVYMFRRSLRRLLLVTSIPIVEGRIYFGS